MSDIKPDQIPPPRPASRKRRVGLWRGLGFIIASPVATFGAKHVVDGARTIGNLADTIKAGPAPDQRVLTDRDGDIDLRATAFLSGTNSAGLERLFANRRRQSAVATKCYLVGGFGFFGFWFYEAFFSPVYASLPYVLGLIALCGVFSCRRSTMRSSIGRSATAVWVRRESSSTRARRGGRHDDRAS